MSPKDGQLVESSLPKLPEDLLELQTLYATHPTMFVTQANLLRARFDALLAASFTEEQAMQIILRWGLKKNLADD